MSGDADGEPRPATMQATATPTAPPTATPTGTPAASRTATESAAPTGSATPTRDRVRDTHAHGNARGNPHRDAERDRRPRLPVQPRGSAYAASRSIRRPAGCSCSPISARSTASPDSSTSPPGHPIRSPAWRRSTSSARRSSCPCRSGFLTVCIKPIVPVRRAGVLACNGGVDLGVSSAQDHNIGTVGMDGFTAQDCDAAGGTVEAPERSASGRVQRAGRHPAVARGRFRRRRPADRARRPLRDRGTARGGDDRARCPCDTMARANRPLFGFVSGVSRATITDANNAAGAIFQHDEDGENFSCPLWMQERRPRPPGAQRPRRARLRPAAI